MCIISSAYRWKGQHVRGCAGLIFGAGGLYNFFWWGACIQRFTVCLTGKFGNCKLGDFKYLIVNI